MQIARRGSDLHNLKRTICTQVPYPQYKNWLDLEPPEGKFTSVEASEKDYWACALREDQGVTCWGKVKSDWASADSTYWMTPESP